jgi:hypothetical protein
MEEKKRIMVLCLKTKKIETAITRSAPKTIRLIGKDGKGTMFLLIDNSKRNPRNEKEKANRKPCLNDQG